MILASEKCIFDLKKKRLGYKPFKNKKYFKNYFVKEASICSLYGKGCQIGDICPLRKFPHDLQNYKLFWIPKRGKVKPLGPKKIWVPKVT